MSRNNKFIDAYRNFESAVKNNNYGSVKEYEESLADNQYKREQVRICRLIRNYIEYENAGFVEATDNMIGFLEKETMCLDENEIPVKKKMIPLKNAIRDSDLLVVAADFMTKRKADMIPVFDKSDFAVGVLSNADIVKYIASGDFTKARKVAAVQTDHKFGFLNESTPMKKVRPMIADHKKIYLVLSDSKKVVGWIG
jgi:predicted transcriptional regulator